MSNKLQEALHGVNVLRNSGLVESSNCAFEVCIHNPDQETAESFFKLFGFENSKYISESTDPFYVVRVNKYIVLYTRHEPPCEKGLPDRSIEDPVASYALAYAFFLGKTESYLANPELFDPDQGIAFNTRVHFAPGDLAEQLVPRIGQPAKLHQHEETFWFEVGETFTIFLQGSIPSV